MKLYSNPASPFVNKTLIIAHECGLLDEIERVDIALAPGNPNHEFGKQNPLRQIPALINETGTCLYDSFVICDYLIARAGNKTLLPADGPERTHVLHMHALCNGIMERAVATRYETFARPEEYRWPAMIDDNFDRIDKGLAWLNANIDEALAGPFDLASATFVAMLKYLDFRFDHLGWRTKYPALKEPFDALSQRSCVKAAYPAV